MRTRASIAAAASFPIVFLMLFGTLRGADSAKPGATPTKVGDYTLTGPYAHDKLWPKLIKSSAVEAVADLQKDKPAAEAKAADVYQCMSDAAKGKESEKTITPRVRMVTRETKQNVVFQTLDGAATTQPVHENYVNKQ